MAVEVDADLIVDDGAGGSRQLSVDDFKSVSALRLDEASATITYVGEAAPASSEAAAVWRIKRINEASGVSITWADGNTNFDNVWANRAALTYS